MKKKAALSLVAFVAALALGAVIYAAHSTPNPSSNTNADYRPSGQSEIQAPPRPTQLKPVERVVITSK